MVGFTGGFQWISLKTVSGSGISWAICKSAPRSIQITTPAPHHSVFFTGRMPFLPPNRQHQSTEGNTVGRNWHEFLFKLYNMACSGVTSHRQPRRCRGAQGPKTVKRGPKVTDPNYVSRLLDCVPVFHKIITPPTYFTVRSECSPGAQKL